MTVEPWELPAWEIARSVADGERSALEVVESCLGRIERVEPAIRAWIELRPEEALEHAADLDERRRRGEDLGLLAGVPVAIKDNIAVGGWPLSCGSRILEGYTSPFSATAVERLWEAGAVVLGRVNLDELGMGSSCETSAAGITRNPWDVDLVPGGSSGGSAAAVAAGEVPMALGSDTGGSVRQPAAFCGLVGLRPSYGRIPRWGLVAFASSLDQIGPIARCVRDVALAGQVCFGVDDRDATSADEPVPDLLGALDEPPDRLRFGVLGEARALATGGEDPVAWDGALDAVASAGAELVEVSAPSISDALATYYLVAATEASSNLARFDGVRYGRRAPEAETLEDLWERSRSEGFGREVRRRILVGTQASREGYRRGLADRARLIRRRLREELLEALGRCDALVLPTTPGGAFQVGERIDDPVRMAGSDVYTVPASLAGLPAVALPSGIDRRGMPLSIQLVGAPFGEARLLRTARALEGRFSWTVDPPWRRTESAFRGGKTGA